MVSLGDISSTSSPIIIPVIYSLNRSTFNLTQVFPNASNVSNLPLSDTTIITSDTTIITTDGTVSTLMQSLSLFTLSTYGYDTTLYSIEQPHIAYSSNEMVYNFTFFGFGKNNKQFLFNYKLKPSTFVWQYVDSYVIIPLNIEAIA
jgi:hypothetical protein